MFSHRIHFNNFDLFFNGILIKVSYSYCAFIKFQASFVIVVNDVIFRVSDFNGILLSNFRPHFSFLLIMSFLGFLVSREFCY